MKNANLIDEKHIISCNIQQCISIIEHYQRIEEHENPHNTKENEKVMMMMMKLTLRKRRDEEERKNECRQCGVNNATAHNYSESVKKSFEIF